MEKIISTAVALNIENIDTDQIIPARFLKRTSREGFGAFLFYDWRYDKTGNPKIDFPLNENRSPQPKVLVAANNFGCGSSREHAAWSIADYGFRAIISTQFADIFKNNALNNGILTIEVLPELLEMIFNGMNWNKDLKIEIDLATQSLEIPELAISTHFEIDAFKKKCISEGISETEFLIQLRDEISAYEKTKKYITA